MRVETKTPDTDERDEFVSDPVVARELGISLVTMWRHDSNKEMEKLDWPAKIQIGKRNFRSRNQLEAFKEAMLKRAMAERKKIVAADA